MSSRRRSRSRSRDRDRDKDSGSKQSCNFCGRHGHTTTICINMISQISLTNYRFVERYMDIKTLSKMNPIRKTIDFVSEIHSLEKDKKYLKDKIKRLKEKAKETEHKHKLEIMAAKTDVRIEYERKLAVASASNIVPAIPMNFYAQFGKGEGIWYTQYVPPNEKAD